MASASSIGITRFVVTAAMLLPLSLPALSQTEEVRRETIQITAEDGGKSRAALHLPKNANPKTAVLIMYSGQSMESHWALVPLARAGFAASGHANRFTLVTTPGRNNEEILLDIAAGIRYLKKERGIQHVVVWGWSGGGALMSHYQREAETAPPGRSRATPTGDPPDLNKFDLPKADGIIFHAPIIGSAQSMRNRIDPSVTDENDPFSYDPSLDMFNPANGYRPPPESSSYSKEFVKKYRAAQATRMERIEKLASEHVREQDFYKKLRQQPDFALRSPEEQRLIELRSVERFMLIYRMAADLRYNDLSLDPSDRTVGLWMSFQGTDPKELNSSLINNHGVFVFTPRTFLDQRASVSRSSTVDNVRFVSVPTLIVQGTADGGVFLEDTQAILEALKAKDKKRTLIAGGGHNLDPWGPKAGEGKQREEAIAAIVDWLKQRFPF